MTILRLPAFLSLRQSATGIAFGVQITILVIFEGFWEKVAGLMYMNGKYNPFKGNEYRSQSLDEAILVVRVD
jgi:hypothetical protein